MFPLSTYSTASSLILFVLSSYFNTLETPFHFVIVLAGLVSPIIHFTSAISLYLYNYRKYNTLIITACWLTITMGEKKTDLSEAIWSVEKFIYPRNRTPKIFELEFLVFFLIISDIK